MQLIFKILIFRHFSFITITIIITTAANTTTIIITIKYYSNLKIPLNYPI